MKKFFEDTSSSKTFTNTLSIKSALKHPMVNQRGYELRFYFKNPRTGKMEHELLGMYVTRQEAEIAKSFKEFQYGKPLAICASQSLVTSSIDLEAVGG